MAFTDFDERGKDMGLDTTHDAWSGAYSAFHRWRSEVARLKGLPPLELMQGFYEANNVTGDPLYAMTLGLEDEISLSCRRRLQEQLPISWECLKDDPIHYLLFHSDCDGKIEWWFCKDIAESLEAVIPLMDGEGGGRIGNWEAKTQAFVDGLLVAYYNYEHLGFH